MWTMAKRNLKIFFRDKVSVFFSLLGVFIIIGLYVLFLGDMMVRNVPDMPDARYLMDSWIMAGVLAVATVTTSLGGFGVIVDDKANKVMKDFAASPLSRRDLAGGYILSGASVALILGCVAFVLAEIYIVAEGGQLLKPMAALQVLGCILLSVFSSSAMVFLLVSFLKSQTAFGTASTVVGTLIGFLTGVYIPVGVLPAPVQGIVKLFPPSHAALLFRRIMMAEPMKTAFGQAPPAVAEEFRVEMGMLFKVGDAELSTLASVGFLLVSGLIFYHLAIFNLSRKSKSPY